MAPSKSKGQAQTKKGRGRPKGSVKKSKPKANKAAAKKAAKAMKKEQTEKKDWNIFLKFSCWINKFY